MMKYNTINSATNLYMEKMKAEFSNIGASIYKKISLTTVMLYFELLP